MVSVHVGLYVASVEMSFVAADSRTGVRPRNRVSDGGAHWRQLANTTERSVRGGDAVSCQVTLTAVFTAVSTVRQCSRIRIFCFFSDFKKHDFLRFFEMIYQKVVKSHQQKFSPQ